MLIDLRELREPLVADIRSSLAAFSTEDPKASPYRVENGSSRRISTVGLAGDGFHGTASLHVDTPDHSAALVARWLNKGPGWFAEDRNGKFIDNCHDFAHCIGEFKFPGYPNFYEQDADAPVPYITLDGTKVRTKKREGNEGKNRIVFPFLKAVLAELQPFPELTPALPFRAGVQMLSSTFAEFWIVESSG